MIVNVWKLALCWFAFSAGGISALQNPGIVARMSIQALNYISDECWNKFAAFISRNYNVFLNKEETFSGGSFSMSSFRVRNFERPRSTVVSQPGIGIAWSLQDAGISINFDWSYRYTLLFRFCDSGSADVSASQISVSSRIAFGVNSDGKPTVTVADCVASINKVSVNIGGNLLSYFYEMIAGYFDGVIKRKISAAICDATRYSIDDKGAAYLATLKTKSIIENMFVFDYSLVANPNFRTEYFETAHSGVFRLIGDPLETSLVSPNLHLPPSQSSMLTVFVSEYTLNTLVEAISRSNLLLRNLTQNDLPPSNSAVLNTTCKAGTTCVGTVFPQIADKYPGLSTKVAVKPANQPKLTIGVESVTLTAKVEMSIIVPKSDFTEISAVTLTLSAVATATVFVVDNKLTGKVSTMQLAILTVTSNEFSSNFTSLVGNINLILTILSDAFIVPRLNEVAGVGFNLPTFQGLGFLNVHIRSVPNAFIVSSDIIADFISNNEI